MIRKFQLVLASSLLLSTMICVAGQRREPVRRVFERLSGRVVVLGPNDFIYGFRDSSRIPKRELALLKEFTGFLETEPGKPSDYLPLLKHRDPKVRTLALVALYNLEDPTVLPDIFPLVTDEAATFVAIRPYASSLNLDRPLSSDLTEPQTVGKIATSILNAYLETGAYSYGPLGMHEQPGFKEYWKSHGGRASTAGWWKLRLSRASHETMPTPANRYAAIKRVRAGIDKLPEPDRTFTLLRLQAELGAQVLVTQEELVAMLKQLGPENLLDLLRRKIRTDDPDLQPENNHSPQGVMSLFILRHSASLLRPGDAQALLDQEVTERNFQNNSIVEPTLTPWWAIGAAQLNSREAEAILKTAYGRFQGEHDSAKQLELAQALWRLVGESQAETVADWVYNELARPMGQESNMLDRILRTNGRRNAVLAKALIEDRRFDELNWKSLEMLGKAVNSWTGKEIVPAKEMEDAWSPLGTDFFMRDKAKALAQYPKQIGELLNTLSRWREALRKSVKERPAVPTDTLITLQRYANAFGGGANYVLTIGADGTVIFRRLANPSLDVSDPRSLPVGPIQTKIPVEKVLALVAEFERIQFFLLKEGYARTEDGCPGVWSDQGGATISITMNRTTKTILHYHGCAHQALGTAYPSDLTFLENKIDEVVGTEQWLN